MAMIILATGSQLASAATMTNSDAAAQTIIVTEGSETQEVVLVAGETISFCPSGCFLTMPNGDREALLGGEAVTIKDGHAVIK